VAPSMDLATEIAAELGPERPRLPVIRAIPTGLAVGALQALDPVDPRSVAGWPTDAVVVVSVGRLAREKSLDLLLAAFAHASQADPLIRLLLVGDGPLRAELQARAQEPALDGLVHLTGGVPRLRALALAAGSDLFAFASRTETQGLVLAEALTVGVPVVALEGPGVHDSVRDGIDGEVVPREPLAGAARRLGDAIRALAADPQRRAVMSAAAREGAARFALDKRIGEVVDLYWKVLASR
jgi:1,2-diacylglycerol 3-alpha-glucosyltransferase